MKLIIKELKPNLASDFINYFESLSFKHSPEWSSCFCRYYYNDCSNEQWFSRTSQNNMLEAKIQITNGNMKGFLAYSEEKCIGWLSANDIDKMARIANLKAYTDCEKVACTNCFVIHPDYRNMGVARKLLEYAIKHFRDAGFDCMMAMPVENSSNPEKRYRGTRKMFLEQGYRNVENEEIDIMILNF